MKGPQLLTRSLRLLQLFKATPSTEVFGLHEETAKLGFRSTPVPPALDVLNERLGQQLALSIKYKEYTSKEPFYTVKYKV